MGQLGLTTAQHLCSTLVSLVNPGLIGISLKEKKMDELMEGWMDRWVDSWMDGWIDGGMVDEQTDE